MATYLYYCMACDTHLEVRKPISECNDPQLCNNCKGVMKRLYTPPAIAFKGGGWGGKA